MYQSFRVKNFRCFDDLELNDLARINLIAGKNNTGKTSLLEAIMLHAGKQDVEALLRIWDEAEFKSVPDWHALFYGFDASQTITLSGIYNDRSFTVEAQFVANPNTRDLNFFYTSNGKRSPNSLLWREDAILRPHGAPSTFYTVLFLRAKDRVSLNEQAKLFSELDVSGNLNPLLVDHRSKEMG